ncbi:hypothetical protein [Photobacterium galatheae]|uniref:Uncharacterized protein n=1 Tax=Photobacterium galatheae TaxID=1654360 RepID=A0A066S0B1_9GAMM|nr:hypothetical protein [Photobacterium galatheae]KDM93377.1 hypothetical protein EA58_00460 [Photobacterium galatheae]MCM0146957.1 hypothetical protein [Photobacterium galatheae]
MIKIIKDVNGREYEFQIRWNNENLINGEAEFILKAIKSPEGGTVEAIVKIILMEESVCIVIDLLTEHGWATKFIPITELFQGESQAEQFIENMPPLIFGDPILGCLMRSGLSALIGEILSCKDNTSEVDMLHERLLAICRCLRAKSNTITIKITLRAMKCMCFDMG